MPYKARLKTGQERKRKKPGYCVSNCSQYNLSLKRRGMISLYFPAGDVKSQFIDDKSYAEGVSGVSVRSPPSSTQSPECP